MITLDIANLTTGLNLLSDLLSCKHITCNPRLSMIKSDIDNLTTGFSELNNDIVNIISTIQHYELYQIQLMVSIPAREMRYCKAICRFN